MTKELLALAQGDRDIAMAMTLQVAQSELAFKSSGLTKDYRCGMLYQGSLGVAAMANENAAGSAAAVAAEYSQAGDDQQYQEWRSMAELHAMVARKMRSELCQLNTNI